jgi:transposase-like protein
MPIEFDFEATLKGLRAGRDLNGPKGILTPVTKQLTEAALKGELEQHLAKEAVTNRKNGSTRKTIKSPSGNFELETPSGRAGTFEPQLVRKNQIHLTDELERKIITLFAQELSYQVIRAYIQEIYDMEISNGSLNAITYKLLPELKAWQERELESFYPLVWPDAIH